MGALDQMCVAIVHIIVDHGGVTQPQLYFTSYFKQQHLPGGLLMLPFRLKPLYGMYPVALFPVF